MLCCIYLQKKTFFRRDTTNLSMSAESSNKTIKSLKNILNKINRANLLKRKKKSFVVTPNIVNIDFTDLNNYLPLQFLQLGAVHK